MKFADATIRFKLFLCHFCEAMPPVTIDMRARACLTKVWRCPYNLGLGWAGRRETRSSLTVNRERFPAN